MIDYVTLMLINMTAALAVLAVYVCTGMDQADQKSWVPAFMVPGLVGTVCGFVMTFTWPLPSPYNIAFGELSVMLGMLMLGAALALAMGWNLLPLGIYAFFAGVTAILIGIRFINLGLSHNPVQSGIGFILAGLGGVFAGFVLWKREWKIIRHIGAIVMLAAVAVWAWTGYMAYWGHMTMK